MKCMSCGDDDVAIACAVCGNGVCYDCAKHSEVHNAPICAKCKIEETLRRLTGRGGKT